MNRFAAKVLYCVAVTSAVAPADPRIAREERPAALRFDARITTRAGEDAEIESPAGGWRAGRALSFALRSRCVAGAVVSVDLEMPEHGHGPALVPVVTARVADASKGACAWKVDAAKFPMPGWWRVTFTLARGGRIVDAAVFSVDVL